MRSVTRRARLTALVIAVIMMLTTPVMAIPDSYSSSPATDNVPTSEAGVQITEDNNEQGTGEQDPVDGGGAAEEESDASTVGRESNNEGAAEDEDAAIEGEVDPAALSDGEVIGYPASYMIQDMISLYESGGLFLYDNGEIVLPEDIADGTITAEKKNYGLKFKCTGEQYNTYRFQLKDKLDFSGNPVGRISVDGLADRGLEAKVNVYLDDETEPVATIKLRNQMGKYGWTIDGEKTVDVLYKNITGEHTVSFSITVTGKKTKKNGLPTQIY